jgi:Mn-containing catalase
VEGQRDIGYRPQRSSGSKFRHSAIVALLAKSFAEEANADMLLTPTARSLMNNA